MPRLEGGLDWNRYNITKSVDAVGHLDRTGKHWFALNCDTDHHARVALEAYANSIMEENEVLADDILDFLHDTSPC